MVRHLVVLILFPQTDFHLIAVAWKHFLRRIYTGCIKKKEPFRNQAYCKKLNAFSIAHMLNRGA
jgi:hypothetical protein